MVIEIKLNRGQTTIDDVDAELVELKWYKNSNGYAAHSVRVGQKCTVIQMHRVIMERKLGRPLLPGEEVDHINGDPVDNRRSNIRLANDRQQAANSKKKCFRKGVQPSSDLKGVSWDRHRQMWRVQKWLNGQKVLDEDFDDEIEAALTHDRAAIKYDGEFAWLNYPWGLVPPTTVQLPLQVKPEEKLLHKGKPKTSRFYGVCWSRRDKKWVAGIRVNYHFMHLGNFDDEVEAARTVDRFMIDHFGVDVAKPKLNFPISDYTATSMVGRIVKDVLSYT